MCGTTLKKCEYSKNTDFQSKSVFFYFLQARKNGKILPFEVEQKVEIKGGDKRWSKNLHRIRVFLTYLQCFTHQENVVGFLLLSILKTVGKMKRSSFNVLFFLKKTKLLKNGEASVCMHITVDGTRVENNIRKSIDQSLWNPPEAKAANHAI